MRERIQDLPLRLKQRWKQTAAAGSVALLAIACGPGGGTSPDRGQASSPAPSAVTATHEPSPSASQSGGNAYEGQRYRAVSNGPGQLAIHGKDVLSGEREVQEAVADIADSCGPLKNVSAQSYRDLAVSTTEPNCVEEGIHEQPGRVLSTLDGKTFTVTILSGNEVFIQAKKSTGLGRGGRQDGDDWVNSLCPIGSRSVVPLGADLNPGEYATLRDVNCAPSLLTAPRIP